MHKVSQFFFDTADGEKTLSVWGKLKSAVGGKSVVGFTTNPNALNEVGIRTLSEMEERVKALSEILFQIRGDNQGIIYLQIPNSKMSKQQMQAWIEYIRPLAGDKARTAVKLTPKIDGLTDGTGLVVSLENPGMLPNITGVADSETAIYAFEMGKPAFVSLIWGRMLPVCDPAAEFSWTEKQRALVCPSGKIIAGSLRDLETLKGAVRTGAVPTIGFRFWDQVGSNFSAEDFVKIWSEEPVLPPDTQPILKEEQRKISEAFFTQMDELGRPLYEEFIARPENTNSSNSPH